MPKQRGPNSGTSESIRTALAQLARKPERFWTKVQKTDGCWLWTSARDQHGYGLISFRGVTRRAHRIAFALAGGAVPDGLVVRHRCDNPPCVNPHHLAVGTTSDNMRDSVERGHRDMGALSRIRWAKVRAKQAAARARKAAA